jgi:hypothetical protein
MITAIYRVTQSAIAIAPGAPQTSQPLPNYPYPYPYLCDFVI